MPGTEILSGAYLLQQLRSEGAGFGTDGSDQFGCIRTLALVQALNQRSNGVRVGWWVIQRVRNADALVAHVAL